MDASHPKTIRESLGWSQDTMADYLGIDRSSVSRIEAGKQPVTGPVRRLLDGLVQRQPDTAS